MSTTYNAMFSYAGANGNVRSIKVCLIGFTYGWSDPMSPQQVRKGIVYEMSMPLQQSDITVTGQSYFEDEMLNLSNFIRGWQLYSTSVTKPSLLKFRSLQYSDANIPEFDFNYLIVPLGISAGAKKWDYAPQWQMSMKIASDLKLAYLPVLPNGKTAISPMLFYAETSLASYALTSSPVSADDVYGSLSPDDPFFGED